MRKTDKRGRLAIRAGAIAAVLAATVPAGFAHARGPDWQPFAFPPYDAACGSTVVHVKASVNREFARASSVDDAAVYKVTGALRVNFRTDAGTEVTVNASGPGQLTVWPDGSYRVQSHGLNAFTFNEEQAQALGVPQISVSSGPFDVHWDSEGAVSGHLGTIIRDVCAELT